MAVRNCREIGANLQLIVRRLMANDTLVNLLYYTDVDPLANQPLTDEQKREKIFEKLIKITPVVTEKELSQTTIAITVIKGNKNNSNNEFRDVSIRIETFIPLNQWLIRHENLRPFLILGEIQESLDQKTVNGLGKLDGGDFELSFLTNEVACYTQMFDIITYD